MRLLSSARRYISRATASKLAVIGTSTALASTLFAYGVFLGKWMAALTNQLTCIFGGNTFTSQNIDLKGNGLQVLRVNAAFISTQMVQRKSVRDRADEQFIRHSVSQQGTIALLCLTAN